MPFFTLIQIDFCLKSNLCTVILLNEYFVVNDPDHKNCHFIGNQRSKVFPFNPVFKNDLTLASQLSTDIEGFVFGSQEFFSIY